MGEAAHMAKTGGAAQQAAIAIEKKGKAAVKKTAAKKSPAKKVAAKKTAEKKAATKKTAGKVASKRAAGGKSVSLKAAGKDPKGGLTAAGRKQYNEATGGNLKPGVKGTPKNAEEKKRKGSFLTRHFTNPPGPVVKDGKPTRQALQAAAWGEPVPKTEGAEKKLAAKGRKLLKEAKGGK